MRKARATQLNQAVPYVEMDRLKDPDYRPSPGRVQVVGNRVIFHSAEMAEVLRRHAGHGISISSCDVDDGGSCLRINCETCFEATWADLH